jgi:hypothetical protein
MRRTPVGSTLLGSGYLVLCADTRENPGGKNRVITVMTTTFLSFPVASSLVHHLAGTYLDTQVRFTFMYNFLILGVVPNVFPSD